MSRKRVCRSRAIQSICVTVRAVLADLRLEPDDVPGALVEKNLRAIESVLARSGDRRVACAVLGRGG